jgi:hypothetical protein
MYFQYLFEITIFKLNWDDCFRFWLIFKHFYIRFLNESKLEIFISTVGYRLLCCFIDNIWVALHRHHNINKYIYIYIHIQTSIRSHYHLITCIYWWNSLRLVTIHRHFISFFLLQYTLLSFDRFFLLILLMMMIEKKTRKIFAWILKIFT